MNLRMWICKLNVERCVFASFESCCGDLTYNVGASKEGENVGGQSESGPQLGCVDREIPPVMRDVSE